MSDQDTQAIRAAAVLYTPETTERSVLAAFAEELKTKGLKVGGLVQQDHLDDQGVKDGIDAIAVDTGEHIPLKRPTESDFVNGVCSLDHSALTESTGALRRAINNKADLMIVEKFGEQEQKGAGLADEILSAMAEGIPIIATNIEGNVELVSDGYNGILIQPQKPILLAEAILNMLIDPEKALNMGRNGKKQINRFFSKDAMVNKTTSLYAKYLY